MTAQDTLLLTVQQLAERLGPGVKPSSLRKMHSEGLIPSISYGPKLGGRRFIERDVREALARLSKPLRPYHPPKEKSAERNEGEVGTATKGAA